MKAQKKILSLLVAATPENALAWFNLGTAYFNLGELAEAEKAFQRVRDLGSPLAAGAALCLAKCARKAQRFDEALRRLNEIAAGSAKEELAEPLAYERRQLAQAMHAAAAQKLEKGEAGEALSLYERSLSLDRDGEAVFGRALALTSLLRYPEAREAFRAYVRDFSEGSFAADARYFLDRLESSIGTAPYWLNVDVGGGYDSNIFLTGATDGPVSAPALLGSVTGGAQITEAQSLIARLTYSGSWLDTVGQPDGRLTSQVVQGQIGYRSPGGWVRFSPAIVYQTYGPSPYELQGTGLLEAQRNWGAWGIGIQAEIDQNYGQIPSYTYLNGNNYWGEVHLDYLGYRFELRLSYGVLYENISDLVSEGTTLPLRDLAQGPAARLYWSFASAWEAQVSSALLFRDYLDAGSPGGQFRFDDQWISAARVSLRLATGLSVYGQASLIWNGSNYDATSRISNRNYTQLITLAGVSWNAVH